MTSLTTRAESDADPLPPRAQRPSPKGVRKARQLVRMWGTPSWIRTLTATAVFLALALGIFISNVAATALDGVTTIGHQAAPQVATSADLAFALSDMDGALATLILAGNDSNAVIQPLDRYEERRKQVNADLQLIAGVSGADPSALQAVRSELDQLGRYQASAAASAYISSTEGSPGGRPSKTVLQLYQPAAGLMHDILATALKLTSDKHEALKRTYQAQSAGLATARLRVAILGGALVIVLLVLQVYLRVRLRRRLNPAMALATAATVVLTLAGWFVLSHEATHLKIAEQDAFDSIVALSGARALSYDASAIESRYLVDPGTPAESEQAFHERSQELASLPGVGFAQYENALDAALNAYRANHADVRFGGYFATEMKNITFGGEREAVEKMLAAYQAFQRDDRQLRTLVSKRDFRGAIAFKSGTTPGTSNYDFDQYDKALTSAIKINQDAFDTAIRKGEHELRGWTDIIPATALLIAALVALGAWPRLAEYR